MENIQSTSNTQKQVSLSAREIRRNEEYRAVMKAPISYRNTIWHSRDGYISIQNMSESYIHGILNTLERKTSTHYSGLSASQWRDNLRKELTYRNKLGTAVVKKISHECNFDFTEICESQLRRDKERYLSTRYY